MSAAYGHLLTLAMIEWARTGRPFSADDLHLDVPRPPSVDEKVSGRVFSRASELGLIVRVGVVQSTRGPRRAGWTGLWRGVRGQGIERISRRLVAQFPGAGEESGQLLLTFDGGGR